MNVIKPYRFIPKEEIERQANDLLKQMEATQNLAPKWPFDATRVADFLDLGVVWDRIEPDEEGPIAAMILPLQSEIVINEDISAIHGGFGESTLAHEIGHWELHIDHNAVGKFLDRRADGIEKTIIAPFLCRSDTIQRGIEWQAQYFASCLLMPVDKLEEVQKGRDLTKWPHLYAIKDELGVTISNLTNRLQDIDWIHIPKNSKQIYLGKAAPGR
ncbi:MAG: ImmA/IrrE family metallo-endopeptidase [Hormoscilla sp. GM7CHS1pb]|nr:ImmA/IrrE family metallo-endopeptidase [Hormoscilla sp. GM7CHS1pb]